MFSKIPIQLKKASNTSTKKTTSQWDKTQIHLSNKHQSVETKLKHFISKYTDQWDRAQKHVFKNMIQLRKASNTSIQKHKSVELDSNTYIYQINTNQFRQSLSTWFPKSLIIQTVLKNMFPKYNSVEKGFKYIIQKTQVSGTRLK